MMKASYVAPGEEPFQILLSDMAERMSSVAVAFRKGKWLFGTHAAKAAVSNPESTFTYIGSHLLGRQFNDPVVEAYRSTYLPQLQADPVRGTVMAADATGKYVPIEHILALYLESLKEHAETFSSRYVAGTVFTVPSYYDQIQRQALLDAAEMAGIKVYALINPASAGTPRLFCPHSLITLYISGGVLWDAGLQGGAPAKGPDFRLWGHGDVGDRREH